ncbi:uncharacterized protein V6R79_012903 [Siganus canaliculatus]
MPSFSWLKLCFLSLAITTVQLQSSDTMMFTSLGESVTLPCEIHSITSCSSVDWRLAGQHGLPTTLVENGRVKDSKRFELLKDCSLKIKHPALDDAQLYSCDNKILNSSVSLRILEIVPDKASATALELHCFLNSNRGYEPCNNTGIRIQWSTEDNEPLRGSRFRFESPSECFSKLIITKKPTDHHRKWKCRLFQKGIFKTSVSYKTIVPDGVEEVFAAVGESLTLSCGNTSSHQSVWTRGGRVLANTTQAEAFHVTEDSLIISKVIPVHAGDYQCSRSDDKKRVFNKIRLHTVNVTSENAPGGNNLTLTCLLTCAKECEKDFNLTWSGSGSDSWQNDLIDNNSLRSRLFLPLVTSDEFTCVVLREGSVVASKKWRSDHYHQTLAWLALPLGFLILLIAAGGISIYLKRKCNRNAGNEQSSVVMTHVYEVVEDTNNGEHHQRRLHQAATTDSFYDLLQAVN